MWQISHPLQLVQVWVAIFVSKIGLQPLFTRLTSLNLCRIDHGQPGTVACALSQIQIKK